MSPSYFDRSQNLRINGDVTFVSSGDRSTLDNPSFFHVTQRVQAANAQSRALERGLQSLCDNTAPSARYGCGQLFTDPQCYPGTRTAVQDYIFEWLDDEDGHIAMWMNGPVGIGKSAIAQTVASLAAERGQLSSAFFFFRTDESRNTARYLVPTLAYEMTQQMPYTFDHVCTTIAANPLIFSSALERQIRSILLQPLSLHVASYSRARRLIIIDGLDECLDTNIQRSIIRSFVLSFLLASTESIPHKILLVSRPESHIASAFSSTDIFPHVKYLDLHSWDTEDDIGIFLRAKLDEIRATHPLRHYLPEVWPEHDSFRRLRQQSIGSFAYASAVIRHLASHNGDPQRGLEDLLSLRPTRAGAAFDALDTLYRHILLSLDTKTRFLVRKVLCLYICSSRGKFPTLARFLSEEKSVVEMALTLVSSLVKIDKHTHSIQLHHSSFGEFLRDKERSGDLYVFSPDVASAVAAAFSNLWLRPISTRSDYHWFSRMSSPSLPGDSNIGMDMAFHLLNALVETKLPASFLHPVAFGELEWQSHTEDLDIISLEVANFFGAIQQMLRQTATCRRDSAYRPLYDEAFNIICTWLRGHFNTLLHGPLTCEEILDVLLGDCSNGRRGKNYEYPFLRIFRRLTKKERGSFLCISRVFPELDHTPEFWKDIWGCHQRRAKLTWKHGM